MRVCVPEFALFYVHSIVVLFCPGNQPKNDKNLLLINFHDSFRNLHRPWNAYVKFMLRFINVLKRRITLRMPDSRCRVSRDLEWFLRA
jgi:hypothetical protein